MKCFQENCIAELSRIGVPVHKIIEYTDQAPTQYKNCNAFYSLSQMDAPIVHNFYAVQHSKSVADGAGGHTKRAAWAATLTNKAHINEAMDLYKFCKDNLETTEPADGECCHFHVKYKFQGGIRRPKNTSHTVTVFNTREIHSVHNTSYNGVIEVRYASCSCFDCLNTGEACMNKAYVSE